MKLGFVTAILPDLNLEEVLGFAAETGYGVVEAMCWPKGKAERRYAGVTHVEAEDMTQAQAMDLNALCKKTGVGLSALGYYPNILCADEKEARVYSEHLKKVISAAKLLGLDRVNSFVGRDPLRSLDDNWKVFKERWPEIIKHAEASGVKVGIENCPMLFSQDEWPGGKNIGYCPANWTKMFELIPSANFGLNYDPSHMVWQHMDYLKPLTQFREKIFHVHLKDVRVDQDRLDQVGILAAPLAYHSPKLPGLGSVNWGRFFSVLTDSGYDGAACVEVEDRAYEGSLERRKLSLVQTRHFLDSVAVNA